MKNEKASQGLKYLLVGGGTVLLDLGLYSLFFYAFNWSIPLSNVLAVSIATVTNFVLNRSWAFKSSENLTQSALLYVLLFVFNTIITTSIISVGTAIGFPSAAVKLATQVLVTIWNFFLYRFVIFK